MVKKTTLGKAFPLLFVLSLFAAHAEAFERTTELHLKIMGQRDEAPPHLYEGAVFFSQKPKHPVRFIGDSLCS